MIKVVSINGYEDNYKIDRQGRVYYRKNGEYYLKKSRADKDGYLLIDLTKNKKRKTHRVHRLVAQHFIKNTNNKEQINHKNGIKSDNRVENLEWCTNLENTKHSFEVLGRKSSSYAGRKQKTNINGYQGVLKKNDSRKNPYMARIRLGGKYKSLGHYATAKEAGEAYQKEAKKQRLKYLGEQDEDN